MMDLQRVNEYMSQVEESEKKVLRLLFLSCWMRMTSR